MNDIVNAINDSPYVDSFSPNEIWGIDSAQEPFPDKFAPSIPSLQSRLNKLKIKLFDEEKALNSNCEFICDDVGRVIVHVDGGCIRNGRSDAIGKIGVWFGLHHALNLSELVKADKITNNISELMTIKQSLLVLIENDINKATIVSDSMYAIGEINRKLKRVGKSNPKVGLEFNDLLIGEIADLIQRHNLEINLEHTQEHGLSFGNQMADELATKAILQAENLLRLGNLDSLSDNEIMDEFLLLSQRIKNIKKEILYYKRHLKITIYEIGEEVLVAKHSLSNKGEGVCAKFNPKFDGPYRVLKRLGPNLYLVQYVSDSTIKRSLMSNRFGSCRKMALLH